MAESKQDRHIKMLYTGLSEAEEQIKGLSQILEALLDRLKTLDPTSASEYSDLADLAESYGSCLSGISWRELIESARVAIENSQDPPALTAKRYKGKVQ